MLFGPPAGSEEPQSTPGGVQERVLVFGSHWRPTSSAGPGYSPAAAWPSTIGAAATAGIAVVGTIESVSASLAEPAGAE